MAMSLKEKNLEHGYMYFHKPLSLDDQFEITGKKLSLGTLPRERQMISKW